MEILQNSVNSTVQVAIEVANITSNAEELTAADIASTTAVLDLLIDSAIADPEVQLYNYSYLKCAWESQVENKY